MDLNEKKSAILDLEDKTLPVFGSKTSALLNKYRRKGSSTRVGEARVHDAAERIQKSYRAHMFRINHGMYSELSYTGKKRLWQEAAVQE